MFSHDLFIRLKDVLPRNWRRSVKYWFRGWNANFRMLPAIVGIGVQKGGSTSLYHWLSKHSDILTHTLLTQTGELNYFDNHYDLGEKWYQSNFPLKISAQIRSWLRSHKIKTCEVSPGYIFHPHALERMVKLLPDAKLLVMLRNPVNRAISHYYHQVNFGRESRTIKEAFKTEKKLLIPNPSEIFDPHFFKKNDIHQYSYLSRGLYKIQLERVFEIFPREQVFIIDSHKIFAGDKELLNELCDFLGISNSQHNFPHKNKREYSEVNKEIKDFLREFFKPHDKQLVNLLDRSFSWIE